MFDVGFWELVLIAVVALLVIGPERLPRVARIAGLWMGRARRTLASVKAEIDRELKAEELKEILAKQARSNPLETILEEPEPATRTATEKPRAETTPAEGQPGTLEGTRRDG
jgi:sec-independent protein translocase protein TatB